MERASIANSEHISQRGLAPKSRDLCVASLTRNLEIKLSSMGATMKSDKVIEYSPFESHSRDVDDEFGGEKVNSGRPIRKIRE
ncbi:hypothetical protein U1Q18_006391 [Sarracenia purpurea var. burkii]